MTQQGQVRSIGESVESILAKIDEFNAWNNQFTKHLGFVPDEMFKTEPISKQYSNPIQNLLTKTSQN